MGTDSEDLARVLQRLGEEYRKDIQYDSRIFCVVKLSVAYWVVNSEICKRPGNTEIRIPIRTDGTGKNIPVNTEQFHDFVQLRDNGIIVPAWLAAESNLRARNYTPLDTMYRNIGGNRDGATESYYNPYEVEFYYPPLEQIDLSNTPVN
jgi:hypothetical protein